MFLHLIGSTTDGPVCVFMILPKDLSSPHEIPLQPVLYVRHGHRDSRSFDSVESFFSGSLLFNPTLASL